MVPSGRYTPSMGPFRAQAQYNCTGQTSMKQALPAGQEETSSNRLQGGCPQWGPDIGKEEVKLQPDLSHQGLYKGKLPWGLSRTKGGPLRERVGGDSWAES